MMYAAFFRGLNVGGNGAVKMADLRAMLDGLGYGGVRTYIQSGNAVFCCGEAEAECAARIRQAFAARFGFESGVALRTAAELGGLLEHVPFTQAELDAAQAAEPDVEHLYVYMADAPVAQEELDALSTGYAGPDRLLARGREIYLLCHESVRTSKPAARLAKLQRPLTARNLRTIRAVLELMDAADA